MAALIERSWKLVSKGIDFAFTAWRFRVHFPKKYGSSTSAAVLNLDDLIKRGLIENVFPNTRPEELQQLLSTPQGWYCGFDPTANSLHIGNLVSLVALIQGQRAGHSPVAVIGGATGLIGDPSGKTADRVPMKAEDVENNIESLMENMERIFHNHAEYINEDTRKLTSHRILNNHDWYREQDVISFMSSTTRHFRLGEMISRHSVQSRLQSKAGISLTEFMYQVFQAADWLHLLQHHNCSIQVGGNDQTGNISSGFDLIHKVTGKYVFGLLVPLLLSPSGEKLGKSTGNSLWLDPNRTSPFELYQFFVNLPDSTVERYLKLLTFLSLDEIEAVMLQQNQSPEHRHGQRQLAEQVTLLVHGEEGLRSALRCTEVLFGDAVSHLRQMALSDLQQLFVNASTSDVTHDPQMTLQELCMAIGCFSRDADAERIIKAGGVYVNQGRVSDPSAVLASGDFILPNNITLVRVGKKNYFIVRWVT
ncbi:tyrosine--tRNA ligase, mitochondrial isoform X2 [Aplysia californica]|uniref:Tyrosine--tRNA ligase n=1 Tax=Aplysia californica TaxID=6500 RepID=A0ABM1VSI6_APLCA|nr:tyrosine--tRNA ligase, mitochondrial isoform X2 [Aplysia californica]